MENSEYVQEQIMLSGSNFFSKQAEESVLCCLLSSTDDAKRNIGRLQSEDFFIQAYGKVYNAIQSTVNNGLAVDLVTVDAAIHSMYAADYNDISTAMVSCMGASAVSFRNIDEHILIVKELSARRQSIKTFEGVMQKLKDPSVSIGEVLNEARTIGGNIAESRHTWQSMNDVLFATYDFLEKRQRGESKAITTGIRNIDNLIGGFYGGEMTIIGARPSIGKSAFAANIAIAAARQGFHVGVVSREMTNVQYGQRMISHDAWLDGMALRKAELTQDDWMKIGESMGALSKMPLSFLFSVRTVEDLRDEVQRKVERHELDMLVVDYLQLMHTKKRFKEENLRIGYISKALKDMSTDFNIPVIALAQVNRDTDGMMPQLRSLKASGDMEQDADGVIFLHRPNSSNDPSVDPRDRQYFQDYLDKGLTYLCIGVAKQRQGVVGKACVLFDPAYMRYIEIDRYKEADI